jgi:fructokinase
VSGAGEIADLAAAMLAKGPKAVLITEGSKGATAYTRGGPVSVAARKVTVADTVGAGDTFNAGVLAALSDMGALSKPAVTSLDAEGWRKALDLGVRAAAVTVSRAGANPPWRHELA